MPTPAARDAHTSALALADDRAPRWMRQVLIAAGIYNLVWGALVVALPVTTIHWLGIKPASNELWPQLWACVGMIVGVYGVGYLAAARDPLRHWPIVLVGLLGKILGPIGFVDAVLRGVLPVQFGWTIITNDLIWWIPFTLILLASWRAWQAGYAGVTPADLQHAEPLDVALARAVTDTGESLRDLSERHTLLVVFLRHAGCTFCREAVADLARDRVPIERQGVRLVIVSMSDHVQARAMLDHAGLTNVSHVSDPTRALYRAFALRRHSVLDLFRPRVLVRGALAAAPRWLGGGGFGIGRLAGDGFQMPGAFLLRRGQILSAFRHETSADRPDYPALACAVPPSPQAVTT